MLGSALRAALAERKAEVIQLVRRPAWGQGRAAMGSRRLPSPLRQTSSPGGPRCRHSSIRRQPRRAPVDAAVPPGNDGQPRRFHPRPCEHAGQTYAGRRRRFWLRRPSGIYGNRGDEVLDENSAPGSGFLADLCRAWEAAAAPAAAAGIRVVHLRFGVVLAPGAGAAGEDAADLSARTRRPARLREAVDELDLRSPTSWPRSYSCLIHQPSLAPVNLTLAAAGHQRGVHAGSRPAAASAGIVSGAGLCTAAGAGSHGRRSAAVECPRVPARLLSAGLPVCPPWIEEALGSSRYCT